MVSRSLGDGASVDLYFGKSLETEKIFLLEYGGDEAVSAFPALLDGWPAK